MRLPSSHNMLIVSTIGRNARVQTFAKIVDSFVDRCLWQVIPESAAFITPTNMLDTQS